MTTNRNLDIIYYKRETIVVLPILNIYWQNIFIIRLSRDLCVTRVWLVDALPTTGAPVLATSTATDPYHPRGPACITDWKWDFYSQTDNFRHLKQLTHMVKHYHYLISI